MGDPNQVRQCNKTSSNSRGVSVVVIEDINLPCSQCRLFQNWSGKKFNWIKPDNYVDFPTAKKGYLCYW